MILNIPPILENNFEGYDFLLDCFSRCERSSEKKVILDFSNNNIFDLNLFAVIVALAEFLTHHNRFIFVSGAINSPFQQKYDEYQNNVTTPLPENNIPFKLFPVRDIQDFYSYLEEHIFENPNVKKTMSSNLAKEITNNLGEVFGNVGVHTSTDKVFCCGQIDIHRKKLDFSIVNLGTTIQENVNRYAHRKGKENIPFTIEWAVGENNTTKETTGGIGLHTLQTYIGKTEGKLQIISSNEFYELHGTHVSNRHFSPSFHGTIVNVEFYLTDKKNYLTTKDYTKYNVNDLL